MGWTAWFTPKHEPDDGPRPSLRDVSFDTTGLKVIAKTPGAIEWKYANDVRVTARLERGTPDRLVRDPYDERYDEPALHARSDDERLDELLPAHPLSRVRAWLQAIQQSLTVAGDLRGDVVAPPDADCAPSQTRQRLPAVAVGVLFMQAGRIDRAEQHLAAGVPMRDGEPVLDTPRLGDTLMLLGVTREALDRGAEAVWAHERAVRVFAALNGDDDPHTIRARANLGRSYAALGRNAEAEPLLTAVIPVFERTNNKSELALALNALGLACQSQARHAEATRCFGRALTLFEELHGPNYAECATVLKNLARSAAATGDQVGSARALKRAESIRWLQVMERR